MLLRCSWQFDPQIIKTVTQTGSGLTGAGGAALLRVDFGVLAVDDTLDLRLCDHTFLSQAARTTTSLFSAFKILFPPLVRPPCSPSFHSHLITYPHFFLSFLLAYLLASIPHSSFCFYLFSFLAFLSFPFVHFLSSILFHTASFFTSLHLLTLFLLPCLFPPSCLLSILLFFHLLHLSSPPSLILNLHPSFNNMFVLCQVWGQRFPQDVWAETTHCLLTYTHTHTHTHTPGSVWLRRVWWSWSRTRSCYKIVHPTCNLTERQREIIQKCSDKKFISVSLRF